jgi:putative nucleotidyltransferase with HDIG domain
VGFTATPLLLDRCRLTANAQDILDAATRALLLAQQARDVETGGHVPRVCLLAVHLALQMAVSDEEMLAVRYGSLLHDIGKLSTPDSILRKPSRHTDEETAVMRDHVTCGAELLRASVDREGRRIFPEAVVLVVAQHHEKWDGSGYPGGLSYAEITLPARIFAVADALDALLSDRCYRPGRSFEEASAEIERCSGSHFDPAVVDAFLHVPASEWLAIFRG